MLKKWNDFYEDHPYWSVWIIVGVSSGVTILIEYIVHRDFIVSGEFLESGFYGMLFFIIGLLLFARRRVKRNKK
ncbi:hypothetical protein PGRAN_13873 [Listeria grandensis FSL F6-0971]|uniref:Uncharacterized protein n=2 Tax=Listeria grandensis TaxID=1494963 RepID=W7BNR0_9LIST|nr:hypothetical protein [Listeria grandensis]EUJ21688.1 hypothetical protein PGRAN_13873 [Listeria grandensis FSL F6-0971]MBC1936016.1 hypothetical protein [Listeria grandensis]